DVAFFLTGGTALGLGRGEELYPLVDLPVMPVLLVLPSFGVATGDAYGWLAEDRVAGASHAREGVRPARTRGDRGAGAELPWRGALPAWGNDLEAAVEARRPAIRRIRLALDRQGARVARMS